MESIKFDLSVAPGIYAVCRLASDHPLPSWLPTVGFINICRTEDELSIVCHASAVPAGVQTERGWALIKVEGPLEFGLTGILASIANPLAEAGISIFALSTFDTDYILVKDANLEIARHVLEQAGFRFS